VIDPETDAEAGPRTDGESAGKATSTTGREGSRFVVFLYVALVAVATTAGALTGTFVENLTAPRFLFLVPLPPTPLGFAAYGAVTVAVVLGVPLALVARVSEGIDDASKPG